ncbi:hypothetical protein GCM10010116_08930 [Microbispora rosea subsp. aerata]|nr:hypothetical protein [Microbispora rosea]GGO04516.1 hypothetical protein GCM10010116_08930 [Microbispora rosea subsp. aerata]GIH56329.1 hypothetical protein Mro02_32430 [Microbispora rosea subsp. aerata]GLJ82230.1 hypothetical protein GCM10017588_09550 [Microbispora rosea subsp. aerata]
MRRRWLGLAAVTTVLFGTLTAPGVVPGAEAEPDQQAKLRKLTQEAARLQKEYRGQILSLEDAKRAAQKASVNVKKLRADLLRAQRQVVAFAQSSYMTGGVDATRLFSMSADPSSLAMMTYLGTARAERLNSIKDLIAKQKKAARAADAEIDKLQAHIKELQSRRREVERLMAKFGFQTPDAGTGLTQRMISVRNAILRNFPMPFGYGCLRGGDPGEHGKGRACDFMMSSGGRMPDAVAKARGDALAQWCIDHAGEYGIMYIIWQQRYYDMRTRAGWRMMSDRGGVTANHYDHVHVSVL